MIHPIQQEVAHDAFLQTQRKRPSDTRPRAAPGDLAVLRRIHDWHADRRFLPQPGDAVVAQPTPETDSPRPAEAVHSEINLASIPVRGDAGGLFFALGSVAILLALPQLRWFLIASLVCSVLAGGVLDRLAAPGYFRIVSTSPNSGVDPVSHPLTTSNRTTGCGLFTSMNTAAWTSTPMSAMRGSSGVPWRGSPSFGNHIFQSGA